MRFLCCSNCGYWKLQRFEIGQAPEGLCRNTKSPNYMGLTKGMDLHNGEGDCWGPEGGNSGKSRLEPCDPVTPHGASWSW